MLQVITFSEFYVRFSRIYRFLGIAPVFNKDPHSHKIRIVPAVLLIKVLALIVFWIGVVFTFLIGTHQNDKISVISNWIQMLGNAIAMSTTLICATIKCKDLDNILTQFEKIDSTISSIGHNVDYSNHLKKSKFITLLCLVCFASVFSFDFYVTIDMYSMTSIWYWVVSIMPLFFYGMGLLQAIFMISWIKYRCRLMNTILKTICFKNGPKLFRISPPERRVLTMDSSDLIPATPNQQQTHDILKVGQLKLKEKSCLDLGLYSKLFTVMNDLCKLSRKIDEYFGLFFLTSIGALFAITSIQVYYCYVMSVNFNEKVKISVWTLFVSLNLVIINLFLIIGITSVCESVANEATKILQNFSALQIQKDMVRESLM